MFNSNLEIVKMYDEGFSVAEICAELDYEQSAVENTLLTHSKKYRKDTGQGNGSIGPAAMTNNINGAVVNADLTHDDDKEFLIALKDLALSSDNDIVRCRCLMYLHDEFKGRNDKQEKSGINVNVLVLNKALKEARRQLAEVNNAIVDV